MKWHMRKGSLNFLGSVKNVFRFSRSDCKKQKISDKKQKQNHPTASKSQRNEKVYQTQYSVQ